MSVIECGRQGSGRQGWAQTSNQEIQNPENTAELWWGRESWWNDVFTMWPDSKPVILKFKVTKFRMWLDLWT